MPMGGAYKLSFEHELDAIQEQINLLRMQPPSEEQKQAIAELERRMVELLNSLSDYDRVLLARHPDRPYALDYITAIFDDFIELHGDRCFGDDKAIVAGLAWLDGRPVAVIGQQKGRDAKERQERNFGMAHPEGYRKAIRVMKLADKLNRPVITLIDTSGAACLDEAEARGICWAIAESQMVMSMLGVPTVAVIIGEGGSGGAIAIGVGNKVLMMEYAMYSVIQPESCAAIIWRDESRAPEAAEALWLTAPEALKLGVIDEIIPEPIGGAHRDPEGAANNLKEALCRALSALSHLSPEQLRRQRYEKFRAMGVYLEGDELKSCMRDV
ncbi:MAG: acetyl-CoA carboxylase carboxyltransferase subunit alpha [Armatimonadota bacterium]|nr:acetyl-CoA carboxylase carboxyltransferase subunit alpha [Armatimonadota bacterium]